MIFGMKTLPLDSGWRAAVVCAVVCAMLLCAGPAWAAFDLPELAALLAQKRNAEARFTEERFVSGLDAPLRASGTLSFTAPDRFVRQTLLPQPESMAVDGNNLTLQRAGRTRQMALDTVPELTALIEAIRGTLSGDVARLQKHFRTRVDGTATRWKLSLTPLDQRLGSQVRQLDIEGQGPELRSLELLLSGGDRSVMTIEPNTSTARK